MTYPRAAALCEVLWSPRDNRNYDEFVSRLSEHLKRLDAAEVNYRPLDTPASASFTRWILMLQNQRSLDFFTEPYVVVTFFAGGGGLERAAARPHRNRRTA